MQSKFTRLVFVFILYNYLIINETVVLFRYAVFTSIDKGNYGMLSTREASYQSYKILATEKVQIKGNNIMQDGKLVGVIKRRYSSRKVQLMYKELKPCIVWS